MEREIALDTETTGLSPLDGHRVIEIGCVEMVNRVPTGNNFHAYINPQRDVPQAAVNVHGLTQEFLANKPLFADVAEEFLEFISDSKLIIHNADFDVKFLNAELFNIKKPELNNEKIFCTLKYARKKYPGAANSLDALCRRFNIDNAHRTLHGALLDSEILAEVYLELMGGKQVSINLNNNSSSGGEETSNSETRNVRIKRDFEYRDFKISKEEELEHQKLVAGMENSLWKNCS